MASYPKPGRGAWRLLGGLLPAKAGSTSRTGYYRLAGKDETPVGSQWVDGSDITHHAYCVHLGVQAIQSLSGATVDGWFGNETREYVTRLQRKWQLEADGVVGPATMRAALSDLVKDTSSATHVPEVILGGVISHESGLDPAAVGINGQDHGLAQINLQAHGASVSLLDTLNPSYAIHWTAEDLAQVYRTWLGKTKADPWDIAVAHHNSPLLAKRWAIAGEPPEVKGRLFQIAEYVAAVRDAW